MSTRVLVVDDVETNRDLLSRRLEKVGYEVVSAGSGREALEALDGDLFDVVLLDLHMPEMDGMEVLERVRAGYSKVKLPVIIVSAETDSSTMVAALQRGANDYIMKPYEFPIVQARIEAQVALKGELAKHIGEEEVEGAGALKAGFVLDNRYEFKGTTGEGGFAIVYRAYDRNTDREVAIKVLRLDRISQRKNRKNERERFLQESRLIGALQHPHIVRFLGAGRISVRSPAVDETAVTMIERNVSAAITRSDAGDGREIHLPYIAMDLLRGETLDNRLRTGKPYQLEEAMAVLLPILSAVDAAHQEGIVHRDLKPSNIFLTRRQDGAPHPFVLDFGVAKILGSAGLDLTQSSSAIGTPLYMAPEQVHGSADVTATCDQYTLGVVFYECICGIRPFTHESLAAVVHAVAAGDFPAPREHLPDLDAGLEAVVLRAMSTDPEARFGSVLEFGAALLEYAPDDLRREWGAVFGVDER